MIALLLALALGATDTTVVLVKIVTRVDTVTKTVTRTVTDTVRVPGPIVVRVDTVRVGAAPALCADSLAGPWVDADFPSTYLDRMAYDGCGRFVGRIISSDLLTWTAIPWHAAFPAKRFTSDRQALLYLVGRNTEAPLP